MERLRVALVLLLLTGALAGCTTTPEPGATAPAPGPAVAPPGPRPALPVAVSVSHPWIEPRNPVQLTASAGGAVTYTWLYTLAPAASTPAPGASEHAGHGAGRASGLVPSSRHPGDPLQPHEDGEHNASDDSLEAPGRAQPPALLSTGPVAPGAASEPLGLERVGQYRFRGSPSPSHNLVITVREEAAVAGTREIVIHDRTSPDAFWFEPASLEVAPGTSVVFRNAGAQPHEAAQHEFLWLIAGGGPTVEVVPQETGDFDVVVVATSAAGAAGEARARLLVDATKPPEAETFGPFTGSVEAGASAAPREGANTHRFRPHHATRTLAVNFSASSDVPVPPQVRVTLRADDGTVVAEGEVADAGGFEVADLPVADYRITVEAHQGVAVAYRITATAAYALTPPPRGGAAVADDGHGHAH